MIEALIIIIILGIVGVGVGTGMKSAFMFPVATENLIAISTELKSEGENWRGIGFDGAAWPASLPYSMTDTVTLSIRGQNFTYSRTTDIQKWDPNNISTNAAPVADFVRVKITINGTPHVIFLTNPN